MKGDKIGILGNNGSGKTTFLKMLIGESEPDSGKIKLAKNIDIAYFDQKRSNLKNDESLKKNLCPNGGEYIEVMGKTRHVCGYLKDFMFDPKAASDQVSTLSGGQKNRLMLAKVLANPKNCLILDEPTNDLDMDTLDMLEEILSNYKGTLIVVSHDRDFLDKTINKILAFNGNGDIKYYGGNYSDYEQYIKEKELESNSQSENIKNNINNNKKTKTATKKLTYKLKYELDNIPKEISKLNQELEKINQKFLDPEFFADNNSESLLIKSKNISQKIEDLENRWLELEEMKE
jgi:ATP-binding cassette subfamily F protein uup